MLDELLGRAELKERIAELEEERDRLQSQLDAESERRTEAVRDRQAAQERVNRLEDRIADLEGQLDRQEADDPAPEPRGVETLRGERLAAVLDRIESVETGAEGALTAVVSGALPDAVREQFGDHAGIVERATPCVALTDDAGLVAAALTTPVEPEPRVEWHDGFAIERSWFEPTGRHAVALVRSDLFALGEYHGRERVAVEGFASDVQGNHSKGGFSQSRFERRRDEQIDDHLDRCRAAIEDADADRLFVVGERTVLDEFEDLADATATVDATGDPEAALDDAVDQFWTARLYRV